MSKNLTLKVSNEINSFSNAYSFQNKSDNKFLTDVSKTIGIIF